MAKQYTLQTRAIQAAPRSKRLRELGIGVSSGTFGFSGVGAVTGDNLSIDDIKDLRSALESKAAKDHKHKLSDVEGLQGELDKKFDKSNLLTSTSDAAESDENAYSGSRSKAEDEKRLRKDVEDTARAHISFNKGLTAYSTNAAESVANGVSEEPEQPQSRALAAGVVEIPRAGGGVSVSTLGELENVEDNADVVEQADYVLVKLSGAERWSKKLLREIAPPIEQLQRNLRVVNNLENKNVSASKGELCLLNFTFISQERYNTSEPFQDTGERGLCEISIKNTDNSEFTVIKQLYINSGQPYSFDCAGFLTSGSNQLMIKITGEITGETTPAFVYTVVLTSLSISASNFRWWTAYTGNITLPLNIGGNISKVLHVTVTGPAYNKSYEVPLGTTIYIETAYNYGIEHPGKSGVFNISAYVSSVDGLIRTKTISFNTICTLTGEPVKLLAVHNITEKATNWAENTLFEYSIYDSDAATTSAQFIIKKEGNNVFVSNEDSILTSTKHTFSFPMEIETLDNSPFNIAVHIVDSISMLISPFTIPVNNATGYSAIAGAAFYMNPRTRSNRQGNRIFAINEINQLEVSCSWQNMNWGNDGWIADAETNKILRIMSGANVKINYSPFKKEAARTGKTIEIDYKIDNVTDFASPVLSISSAGEFFTGLRIFPDEIVMYSTALKNRDTQGTYVQDGKRLRLTMTITPDAYGNPGFNLCILYINGVRNREFAYESNDYFATDATIEIGSGYADIDIYGIRVYDSALTSEGVLRNYINWLVNNHDKSKEVADNDVMDINGSEIDFKNTIDQYNVFVFNNAYPSLSNPNEMAGTLEVFYSDHPEWNVSISNVKAKGQGTSSMRYWKWNVRFTLDKSKSVITNADGSTTTGKWRMVPTIPAGLKFTAKKNFASSMHSHKIGSVNSVHELFKAMGLTNEAMQSTKYADARIAVYQKPFVAFEKAINEEGEPVYTFMGLYTMGPDKGDKYCFGYDTDIFPNLLALEGSDNAPLCTLFRVPWNSKIRYNEDEEAFQYNGINSFDFGGGDIANIDKWIPGYNIAYLCSNRLKPFNGTLSELNAQAHIYRNEPYEFWITAAANQYNVYYYETAGGVFVPSDIGSGTVNLKTQLVDKGYGLTTADLAEKTPEQLNELFIAARVQKFRQEAPIYWDMQDTILHRNWVEFHAATDNRAKNTYPYCFGNEGSKWKWRYDDLDTIFDVDNQGLAKKGYFVEIQDKYSTGGSVWNGETSVFWNLLELAFPNEIFAGMRLMMSMMEELGGLKSGTNFDKLFAYYKKYYFSNAQEYFPQNLYNADAKYAYENAKLAYIDGRYTNDTDPITQALGDHYSAEQRWIAKRILYMMSKYSYGLFSADGTDNITVRAAGNTITYQLTPAMDIYPAIANGTSIIRGNRTKAGEVCSMLIELSGSGDQQNAIQGASYLQDIGEWYDKNVTGSMIVQGKMLREIRLGSKTQPIVIAISSLTISNCVSLQKLTLSRISTLSGVLNLTACAHLREVHIDGTGIVQLRLPEGGGLELVEFNNLAQYVVLKNYPLLTNSGVILDESKGTITDFFIADCPLMNPIELLQEVMEAQLSQSNHSLKRVRVVTFNETYHSSLVLDRLAQLADGTYQGLNSEGLAGEDEYPVLDGTLNVFSNCYEDSIEALRNTFKKLVLNITGEFFLRFRDPEVQKLCAQYWGDGVGVKKAQLEQVKRISQQLFKDNKDIRYFDEFKYFTGLGEGDLDYSWDGYLLFMNSSLMSITMPSNLRIMGDSMFEKCSQLIHIDFNDAPLTKITGFRECVSLTEVTIPATIIELAMNSFYHVPLETVYMKPVTPPTLGWGVFIGSSSTLKIYVPRESVNTYKAASGWKDYASKIFAWE